jgi:ABC-type Fe3+ transport system permease subunit
MGTPSFSLVHREQVIGALKATGSRDPDVLFAAKQALLEPVKPLKFIGIWAYVMGVILCILILTAILGIPLIFFGWWVRKRATQNINTIESAYTEYLNSLGAEATPAV